MQRMTVVVGFLAGLAMTACQAQDVSVASTSAAVGRGTCILDCGRSLHDAEDQCGGRRACEDAAWEDYGECTEWCDSYPFPGEIENDHGGGNLPGDHLPLTSEEPTNLVDDDNLPGSCNNPVICNGTGTGGNGGGSGDTGGGGGGGTVYCIGCPCAPSPSQCRSCESRCSTDEFHCSTNGGGSACREIYAACLRDCGGQGHTCVCPRS